MDLSRRGASLVPGLVTWCTNSHNLPQSLVEEGFYNGVVSFNVLMISLEKGCSDFRGVTT